MAKKSNSFVDEHIEKVVVGLCGVVFVGAVYVAFLSGRFATPEGLDASKLVDRVGEQADTTASAVLNARPQEKPAVTNQPASNDAVAILKKWFGEQADGLIAIAKLESPAARTQPFPPPFYSTTETSPEDRHNLASIVAPVLPVLSTGRSAFELPVEFPPLSSYDGNTPKDRLPPSTRNWVCVAGQVDLLQQDINFKTVKYPDGSYPSIVQVHLERFDAAEPWKGWQPVNPYLPFKPIQRPEIVDPRTGTLKSEGVSEFKELLDSKQEVIARSLLPYRTGGDKAIYPGIPYFPDPPGKESSDVKTRVKKWMGIAQKAKDGKSPFPVEDFDSAVLMLRAVIGSAGASDADVKRARSMMTAVMKRVKQDRKNFDLPETVRTPEKLMPVVAYDTDVIPGHTYSYRMRYEVFNIFAGNRGELLNPADAEKLTVFSDWSPISRTVTIESDTYFYLTRADETKKELTVTVYKKKGRDTAREATFKVQIGEEIGGEKRRGNNRSDFSTGAVCLDIDFNRKVNGRNEVALVYVDTSNGQVREKILSVDKRDKFRQSLANEKTARP